MELIHFESSVVIPQEDNATIKALPLQYQHMGEEASCM